MQNTNKRIAVDIEGVITNSLGTWYKEFENATPIEKVDNYDFPQVIQFIEDTDLVWAYRPEKMLMLEPNVGKILDEIIPFDIVTARANGSDYPELPVDKRKVQDGIRTWIQLHKINCSEVVFKGSKAELDYDFYIDDNPKLAEAILKIRAETDKRPVLILVDALYNQYIKTDDNGIIRVKNLEEAVDKIKELR